MGKRYYQKIFYVYIQTNPAKTHLYVGVTNSLERRLKEHYENRGKFKTYAGRYRCYNLMYYEIFQYPLEAIAREKQIKRWRREKKEFLINKYNPRWRILNNLFSITVEKTE